MSDHRYTGAHAHCEQTIASLRAEVARLTAEVETLTRHREMSNMLAHEHKAEIDRLLADQPKTFATLVSERDEARSSLARVEAERDQAQRAFEGMRAMCAGAAKAAHAAQDEASRLREEGDRMRAGLFAIAVHFEQGLEVDLAAMARAALRPSAAPIPATCACDHQKGQGCTICGSPLNHPIHAPHGHDYSPAPSPDTRYADCGIERDAAREEASILRDELGNEHDRLTTARCELSAAREEVATVIAKADRLTKEYLDRAQTAEAESARLRAQGEESRPDDLRAAGWAVAVHNDYRLNGEAHTFWLFTKDGRAVKGEGRTDADALNEARAALKEKTE